MDHELHPSDVGAAAVNNAAAQIDSVARTLENAAKSLRHGQAYVSFTTIGEINSSIQELRVIATTIRNGQ